MKRIVKDKLDTTLSFRVPAHFHKSLKAEAKKIGITLSDYCTAILISEMRSGNVKQDVEERIARGNMYWAMYPHRKDIYGGTPGEAELMKRAYRVSHPEKYND